MTAAVEIADRVWWVGSRRCDDPFQCHSYLIEAGDDSVLIDPGSVLTIDDTLRCVNEILPLAAVRWLVCHHSDPDIAGGLTRVRAAMPRLDLTILTEWRSETLLRHYGANIPFAHVEDRDWELELEPGRRLQFVLTPYLHFPGAMCTYDESTGVLFSSDLFGGFTDGTELFAEDGEYFETMRPFHEHYMPSREILAAGLSRIRRACGPIRTIAPQHGCLIPERLVDEMFTRLAALECGIFMLARDDLDVARLLRVANVQRRIADALVMSHDLRELVSVAERVLPDVLPMLSFEILVRNGDDGLLRLSSDDSFAGSTRAELPGDLDHIVVDLVGDGPLAWVVIGLAEPTEPAAEVRDMLARMAPLLRVAVNRYLEQREFEQQHDELRESALHDALTGLYNRHAIGSLAASTDRYGLLMIDIDHFKAVNDRFGHGAGDTVLKAIAAAVVTSVRQQDATIRYGGEEILVILHGGDRGFTASVAERIRARVARIDYPDLPGLGAVTVSIGAAVHRPGQGVEAAIAAADGALYRAKDAGRNRVRADWDAA